ncbi:MAG: NAD(P)-dependent oxidoreductase, partial [Deltaproteobacteria bacterium]|nr:NAD(P)-dependent oxidoreductase [Deltaproteobacteria bacterium]
DPFSTFDHSLRTLENALDWSRTRAEQFIYLSSSMIYGHFHGQEVTEEAPLEPIGIYGALKLSGEKLVQAYNQVFDMPYTIIRPSALYGPRCISRRVGQIFIEKALNGQPLRVDGDGAEKLDFTSIEDFVAGLMLAIGQPAALGQVFNLTYGDSRSILDLVKIIQAHFPQVEVNFAERDRLMPLRGTLSIDKARQVLGYEPQNPIEVGFEKYIAWYKDFWEGGR